MITRESLIKDTTEYVTRALWTYKQIDDINSELYVNEEKRAETIFNNLLQICQIRSATCDYKGPTNNFMSSSFLELFYDVCSLVNAIYWYECFYHFTYADLYDNASTVVENAFDIADDRFLVDTDLTHVPEAIAAQEYINKLMENLKAKYGEQSTSLEN